VQLSLIELGGLFFFTIEYDNQPEVCQ